MKVALFWDLTCGCSAPELSVFKGSMYMTCITALYEIATKSDARSMYNLSADSYLTQLPPSAGPRDFHTKIPVIGVERRKQWSFLALLKFAFWGFHIYYLNCCLNRAPCWVDQRKDVTRHWTMEQLRLAWLHPQSRSVATYESPALNFTIRSKLKLIMISFISGVTPSLSRT